MNNSGTIIILVGKTGVGKSTIERLLKEKIDFEKIVSHTTRPKRENEMDGVDYHFIREADFVKNISDYLETVTYQDNFYGTHKDIIEPNKNYILVATPEGAKQLIDSGVNTLIFNIDLPSLEERWDRAISRYPHITYDIAFDLIKRFRDDEEEFDTFANQEVFANAFYIENAGDIDDVVNDMLETLRFNGLRWEGMYEEG